jgi:type I restriction enzyme M protein
VVRSRLWDAANILRGPVDASDFKAYVFPLLFLKRISDVYDEERAQALAESGGDEEYADLPEQHRFQVPDGCHWSDLRSAPRTSARPSSRRCAASRRPTRHAVRHLR